MFRKKHNLPTGPVKYFPGTVVKTESGHWYIGEKTKMKIPNKRVLNSWSFPRIVPSSDVALSQYLKGPNLGFRNGSVLFDLSSGVYYIVANNKVHLIDNPDIFETHNIRFEDALVVSTDDIGLHKKADDK